MNKRVVITGIGINSPLGNNKEVFLKNLYAGKCGIGKVDSWESLGLKTQVAGLVTNIDERDIPRASRRSMGRSSVLALFSTQDAIDDAKLDSKDIKSYDTGFIFGSTLGDAKTFEMLFGELRDKGNYKHQTSMDFLKYMSNSVAANLANYFNIKGLTLPLNSACTTSSQAIGIAYELIKSGSITRAICGGSEGMHAALPATFDAILAASMKYNDYPKESSRPFDSKRDGVVVSEGSGTLILEELTSALQREASIYAEIVAFASNTNTTHLTTPSQDSIENVMRASLSLANLKPNDIGYINAHATATLIGDKVESNALFELFGSNVPVSSIKGQIGHTLAACGVIESIVAFMSFSTKKIPLNYNLDVESTDCNSLDYVVEQCRDIDSTYVINNNFAFGGTNTSLIFKNWTE